uniref:Uncharacterized protein n=1 Tax=Bos mutus grunniens TaxID=30521 RepID=A0A8C0AJG0_BOSMU
MMNATQMQKMNKTMILTLKSSCNNKTLQSSTPRHPRMTRGRARRRPAGMMKAVIGAHVGSGRSHTSLDAAPLFWKKTLVVWFRTY